MPKVEEYINKLQKRVQRQVLIKAKIVEVDSSSGLDTELDISDLFGAGYIGDKNEFTFDYTKPGLSNFKATLQLLAKFGKTTVLSSPVISTLNNQKAKIRVGEFEYFSTGETTNIIPTAGGANNIQTQDIELEPYFSGISLGVTPQVSDDGHIMMKIMPSINYVTKQDVTIQVPSAQAGTAMDFVIPTAKTELREAETMVRVRDGEIIVIGGLTQDGARIKRSGFPGVGYDASTQREELAWKKNIVILLQPIVITNGSWNDSLKSFKKKISDN
jgi:MSHA biogenesis protein MshL